jgi:hypothetical protein
VLDDDAEDARYTQNHCGRGGCECSHHLCDRGWVDARPRVEVAVVTVDGAKVEKRIEHPRLRPCAECKPETWEAARRAPTRKDFLRRARKVKPA